MFALLLHRVWLYANLTQHWQTLNNCCITDTIWFYGKERCAGALDVEMEGRDQLNGKQRHQLKHRELFLSRQVETLPATHIRGKCSVTLLNETESFLSYLNKDVSTSILFCRLRPPVAESQ